MLASSEVLSHVIQDVPQVGPDMGCRGRRGRTSGRRVAKRYCRQHWRAVPNVVPVPTPESLLEQQQQQSQQSQPPAALPRPPTQRGEVEPRQPRATPVLAPAKAEQPSANAVGAAVISAAPAAAAAAAAEEATSSTGAVPPEIAVGEVSNAIIEGMVRWLEALVEQGEDLDKTETASFHTTGRVAMSIGDYVTRIKTYMACSEECFVMAFVYAERAARRYPGIMAMTAIHRLILSCMTLAAKFQDDVFYSNAFYGRVGGIKLQEINKLEAKLLHFLDWNLRVSPEEFEECRCRLAQAV